MIRRIKVNSCVALTLAVIISVSLSCEDDPVEPVVCTTEYVYGLEIRLIDSETGGPTGLGTIAVISDGDYEELALCEDRGPIGVACLAAGERAGTYDITIDAEGYEPWTRSGVRVTKDACHVKTVHIIADLVREES
jgi:hypothetical protein